MADPFAADWSVIAMHTGIDRYRVSQIMLAYASATDVAPFAGRQHHITIATDLCGERRPLVDRIVTLADKMQAQEAVAG
jgi:hypothetical protein